MVAWYYLLVPKDGVPGVSLTEHLESNSAGLIVCQDLKSHRFAYFSKHEDFIAYSDKTSYEKRTFFEVIRKEVPQKLYFDLDAPDGRLPEEVSIETVVEELKIAIRIAFPMIGLNQIQITSSHGVNKKSFHCVVDGWYFSNTLQCYLGYLEVKKHLNVKYHSILDNLYNSHQQFRIFESHKKGTTRDKIWEFPNIDLSRKEKFLGLFVTYTENCKEFPILTPVISLALAKNLPDAKPAEYIVNSKEVSEIMTFFYNTFETGRCFTFNRVQNSIICLKRVRPTYCSICQKVHHHENPFLVVKEVNRHLYFSCRRQEAHGVEKMLKIGIIGPSVNKTITSESLVKPQEKIVKEIVEEESTISLIERLNNANNIIREKRGFVSSKKPIIYIKSAFDEVFPVS